MQYRYKVPGDTQEYEFDTNSGRSEYIALDAAYHRYFFSGNEPFFSEEFEIIRPDNTIMGIYVVNVIMEPKFTVKKQ